MTDTILIVDDSSFIVEGLVAILKKNYHPLGVLGGKQCLEILERVNPSIIILDIMMEPMDGWETLARIKENTATRHIPVLMFSAKKISAEEADEHRINIDDFISKPVSTKKLLEAIEKLLARQKANRLKIESWQSAGIGQERIEEYTSLMTNLEVDMSLLQNMKVQLSLVHDGDHKNRTDFEEVIATIESRIQEERMHEEELYREMQNSVAKDAEIKERAEQRVPEINESRLDNFPVKIETGSSVQPEHSDSGDITYREKNLSMTELLNPEMSVPQKIPLPNTTSITGTVQPDKNLPDTKVATEISSPDFLFEDEESLESSQETPESKRMTEFPANDPEYNFTLSKPSIPIEIPKTNPATFSQPTGASTENIGRHENLSSEKMVHVVEQQYPVRSEPVPSPKPHDKKPVVPNAPLPKVIGSGTDTSLRMSPSSLGISKETAKNNPILPVKNETVSSGGLISKIISMIIGIFKRH
ncbi:MAG: response regulator [Methanoregula sp.]